MSPSWTEAPAAHAAQIYAESSELVDLGTDEHASLVAERLATEQLELLLVVDAETTLARIMSGPHPSAAAFEQVIGGLLDEVATRSPGRRIRAFGEMVDLLCERGERDAALELEELWNRLAQTRDFSLLCGYRVDLFDRETQVDLLPEVCRLHTHVTPAPDSERLAHAVDDALVGVLGTPGAGQVYSLIGTEVRESRVPPSELALMWVSEHMPLSAERILDAARTRYGEAPSSTESAPAGPPASRTLPCRSSLVHPRNVR